MAERLTALDASFLYLDQSAAPVHLASLMVLEAPPGGLDEVAELVRARLSRVPRYRQRVRSVPGRLAAPVWVDDSRFELGYHVRRSALPPPGTEEQLLALASRVISLPLDRTRPLWEIYLVEGLVGQRIAVVTKTHPVMVDGLSALDIGQVLLDSKPGADPPATAEWRPRRMPGAAELVGQAVVEYLLRPSTTVGPARAAVSDVRGTVGRFARGTGSLTRAAGAAAFARPSPLDSARGTQRRVAVSRIDLDQVKRLREMRGAATVNDVLLTLVTGALREWLLSRGEPVLSGTTVRALVPVSLEDPEGTPGGQISATLVDLPVGESNPRLRLGRIGFAMRAAVGRRRSVPAGALVALSGFAPPTMHALAVRAARGLSRRVFHLVVTNVPGPQVPLYIGGSRVLEVFPLLPVVRGQGLAIGMTSYAGWIYVGVNADRDAGGDVDLLATLIEQEMEQFVDDVV